MGPVHTIRKQFIFGDMVSVIFFQLPLVFLVLFHIDRLATSRSHFFGKHRPRLKALHVICIVERLAVAIAYHLLIHDNAQQRRLSIFLAQTPHNNSATNYLTWKDLPLGWSYLTHSEGDRSGKIKYT
jgi:hypothetical protein